MIKKLFFIIFLTLIITFSSCSFEPDEIANDNICNDTVTMLNVGQASCTLIESEGEFCIIDTGWCDGQTDIISYLNQREVKTINLMVLTHFHSDHTSETLDIMQDFNVENILIPYLAIENTPKTSFYRTIVEEAEMGKYNLFFAEEGLQFGIGDGFIKVLNDTNNSSNINDTSVAVSYTNKDFVYVNIGDTELETEKLLIEKIPENISFFTASHHGSSDANSLQFLKKLNPNFVGISCGLNNEYGHPHDEMLGKLNYLGISYEITYNMGNIVYSMNDDCIIDRLQ